MKTGKTFVLIGASALTLALGCAPGQLNDISRETAETSQEFRVQAEDILNRYARGLFERDAEAVRGLLSAELLAQMNDSDASFDEFVEKQRRMMVKTFNGMESLGMGRGFQAVEIEKQEGAVAVTLSRDGAQLPRPFHFVLEGDAYKLNVGRKGFAKPLPAGAAAADHYNVANRSSGPGTTVQAYCEGGGSVTVRPGQTASVSCPKRCGRWFAGARFGGTSWVGSPWCDYNTWGDDVIYSPTYPIFGMACNDPC